MTDTMEDVKVRLGVDEHNSLDVLNKEEATQYHEEMKKQ